MEVPKPVRMGYEDKSSATPGQVGDDLWELHTAGAKLLEFCTGRSVGDYERMEVLRAAVTMLLRVMDQAAQRVKQLSAETAARLTRLDALHSVASGCEQAEDVAVWSYVEDELPQFVGSVAEELQRWHEG